MTRLFRYVWGKEKRSSEFWYELERKDYQNASMKAAVKHKREREGA